MNRFQAFVIFAVDKGDFRFITRSLSVEFVHVSQKLYR